MSGPEVVEVLWLLHEALNPQAEQDVVQHLALGATVLPFRLYAGDGTQHSTAAQGGRQDSRT